MNLDEISKNLTDSLCKFNKNIFDIIRETALNADPEKLQVSTLKQAAMYAYYSVLYAKAKEETLRAEYLMNDIHNEICLDQREKLSEKGEKYTEALIKQLAQRDIRYKEVRNKHLQKLTNEKIIGSMVKALEQKGMALSSLSSNYRAEIKNQIKY